VKLGVQFEDADEGLSLTTVVSGSSAADAGLQEGDILTHIDGEVIKERFDLLYPLSLKRDGDSITLGYLRDGEPLTIDVTLKPLRMAK
jgi:S1-C subfamily serine protease